MYRDFRIHALPHSAKAGERGIRHHPQCGAQQPNTQVLPDYAGGHDAPESFHQRTG